MVEKAGLNRKKLSNRKNGDDTLVRTIFVRMTIEEKRAARFGWNRSG